MGWVDGKEEVSGFFLCLYWEAQPVNGFLCRRLPTTEKRKNMVFTATDSLSYVPVTMDYTSLPACLSPRPPAAPLTAPLQLPLQLLYTPLHPSVPLCTPLHLLTAPFLLPCRPVKSCHLLSKLFPRPLSPPCCASSHADALGASVLLVAAQALTFKMNNATFFESPPDALPCLGPQLPPICVDYRGKERLRRWVGRCKRPLEHIEIHGFILHQGRLKREPKVNENLSNDRSKDPPGELVACLPGRRTRTATDYFWVCADVAGGRGGPPDEHV